MADPVVKTIVDKMYGDDPAEQRADAVQAAAGRLERYLEAYAKLAKGGLDPEVIHSAYAGDTPCALNVSDIALLIEAARS
jgi:hypothetical protein